MKIVNVSDDIISRLRCSDISTKMRSLESCEWLVLEEENGKILLFSETVSRGQNEISFGDSLIEWGYCDQENVDFSLKDTLYISADKIEFPIFIRSFEAGDKIQPIGMKGQKKVSDLINEKKIRGSGKKQVPVLCLDNEVFAVLPWRVSERLVFA